MRVLGIDAGGTKTVCLLADEAGNILGEGRGPAANIHASGELEVEWALRGVIATAMEDQPEPPAAICLGMAGVDREHEASTVRAIMLRIGYASGIVVVNDALVALVAGAGDGPGIVINAGTGSIVYGRNRNNEAARSGGWGHIIGDEGSGYWIGREALTAVMRAVDGRGPATRLTDDILEFFAITDVSRLPPIVYDRELPRANVAALGPIVNAASSLGDDVARGILERAVEELSLAAASVATKLAMTEERFPFILAGGVFHVVPLLTEALPHRLIEVAPRCEVRRLDQEAAVGAVRLAIAEANGGVRLPHYK